MSVPVDASKMDAEGKKILEEMEEARKKGDLPKLKSILERLRSHGAVNQSWVENAISEVAKLEKTQTDQGGTNLLDVAKQYKETGNAKLKEGTKSSLKDAIEQYTTGIALLTKDKKLSELEALLLSQIYGNRAQAALSLREFVVCVDDCKRCLGLDPTNIKAYFRAARASLNNALYQQSIDFCEKGLAVESTNADLKNMLDLAKGKLEGQLAVKEKLNISPQELRDQQDNVNRLAQQLGMMKNQLQQKTTKRKSQELTQQFLKSLPSETGTYIHCGRAFLRQPKETVEKDIGEHIDGITSELPKIEKAAAEIQERYDKACSEFEQLVKYNLPRKSS